MDEIKTLNNPPKIGIDFHVVDGIFQGSRTHVLELFREVIRLSPDLHFVCFLENTDYLKSFSPIFSAPNVELVRMPHTNPIKRLCWQLPMLQLRYGLDILHTQYILPIPCFSAGVVTIHDILFETHPEYFGFFFRLRSMILMRLSARQATAVFTVSEFSKNEMLSRYRISSNKISVIHNGVDISKFNEENLDIEVLESIGLFSKGYLLSVGRLEPRKNHITLLKAYARLERVTMPLVIIGQPHFQFDKIFQVIQELNLKNRVYILSDVKDEELPVFYRHAKIFIYPTWAEGFGMPPLEAMASGVPVISSNSTSIPEMAGEAAILVDPYDIDAFVKAINHLLSDNVFYRDMQMRGFKQVKSFQWNIAAQRVREVYLDTLCFINDSKDN